MISFAIKALIVIGLFLLVALILGSIVFFGSFDIRDAYVDVEDNDSQR